MFAKSVLQLIQTNRLNVPAWKMTFNLGKSDSFAAGDSESFLSKNKTKRKHKGWN